MVTDLLNEEVLVDVSDDDFDECWVNATIRGLFLNGTNAMAIVQFKNDTFATVDLIQNVKAKG